MPVASDGNLTIYVLNVGQADTSVIITPEGNIVIIDAVSPSKLVDLLNKIGLEEEGKIEELIITHPHTDHFRGANRLLRDYKVLSVTLAPFWNKYGMGPATYRQIINKIEMENCPVDFVSGYSRIYPDGALDASDSDNLIFDTRRLYIELLGPPNSLISQLERDDKLNTNHLSVMSRLTWKNFSMIFAADAQMENWAYFDREGMLSKKCNVLRSAHHGSCNGNQWERLDRLNPKSVIISSDPNKNHKLPDLVGTSIFAKFEASDKSSSKIVALTKDTGSIKIVVKNGSSNFAISCFKDTQNEKIKLSEERTLTWTNNPTEWNEMLMSKTQNLFQ